MSEPKHLTVEYDDGSTKTIDFSKLDKDVCLALANLNLCTHQALIGTSKHYVLLEWDGWQEVVGVDRESVELVRYYVIRRIEDRGRLSFEDGSDDPELFSGLIRLKGLGALDEVDGVYSLAYFSKDSVVLARDIIGVKPLFYSTDRGLAFSFVRNITLFFGLMFLAKGHILLCTLDEVADPT